MFCLLQRQKIAFSYFCNNASNLFDRVHQFPPKKIFWKETFRKLSFATVYPCHYKIINHQLMLLQPFKCGSNYLDLFQLHTKYQMCRKYRIQLSILFAEISRLPRQINALVKILSKQQLSRVTTYLETSYAFLISMYLFVHNGISHIKDIMHSLAFE